MKQLRGSFMPSTSKRRLDSPQNNSRSVISDTCRRSVSVVRASNVELSLTLTHVLMASPMWIQAQELCDEQDRKQHDLNLLEHSLAVREEMVGIQKISVR